MSRKTSVSAHNCDLLNVKIVSILLNSKIDHTTNPSFPEQSFRFLNFRCICLYPFSWSNISFFSRTKETGPWKEKKTLHHFYMLNKWSFERDQDILKRQEVMTALTCTLAFLHQFQGNLKSENKILILVTRRSSISTDRPHLAFHLPARRR